MTDPIEALRAVACKGWRWMPGMQYVSDAWNRDGFDRVEAEVYGTFFTAGVSGYNAFVSVGGVRRSRQLRDADGVADLMQETIVRRWRALGRALGV